MNTDPDDFFPNGISDESAALLSEILYDLASACESRYLVQLQRHHRAHQDDLFDPDQPWRRRGA